MAAAAPARRPPERDAARGRRGAGRAERAVGPRRGARPAALAAATLVAAAAGASGAEPRLHALVLGLWPRAAWARGGRAGGLARGGAALARGERRAALEATARAAAGPGGLAESEPPASVLPIADAVASVSTKGGASPCSRLQTMVQKILTGSTQRGDVTYTFSDDDKVCTLRLGIFEVRGGGPLEFTGRGSTRLASSSSAAQQACDELPARLEALSPEAQQDIARACQERRDKVLKMEAARVKTFQTVKATLGTVASSLKGIAQFKYADDGKACTFQLTPSPGILLDFAGQGEDKERSTLSAEKAVRKELRSRLQALEPRQRQAVLRKFPNLALEPFTEAGKPADAAERQASEAPEPSDPHGAEVARLVGLLIRMGQRRSPEWSTTWKQYCDSKGGGSYDPGRHGLKFLDGFLDHIGEMAQQSAPAAGSHEGDPGHAPRPRSAAHAERERWGLRGAGRRARRRLRRPRGPGAASTVAVGDRSRSAEHAAAYWRGTRVQAAEEGNHPLPHLGENGSIQDWGEPQTRECLAFYIDKALEGAHRERVLQAEAERDAAAAGAVGSSVAPRAVVTFLMMENAARTMHQDLLLSLHCLQAFFGGYPVVVFHTNGSTEAELGRLRSSAPEGLRLTLERVDLGFPAEVAGAPGGPDAFLGPPACMMDGQHWWSSHRMCGCRCPAWRPRCWPENWMHATRFFTAGMFRTRTFQRGDFDFFLRLDIDLFFVQRPAFDPFRLMATRGCVMMYDILSREAPGCYDGFDEKTIEFLGRSQYRGKADLDVLHIGSGPAAAGGQWTLGDARLFRDASYLRFADAMTGGVLHRSWPQIPPGAAELDKAAESRGPGAGP
ncbi:unnamed protein product, partial [Prorocentrum cordatum]